MKFAYKAFDRSGKAVSDVLEAAGRNEAEETLRRRGLFVTEMNEGVGSDSASGASGGGWRRRGGGGGGAAKKDMAGFMRQLSVLVATGTPLVDAIASLERQVPAGRWRTTLEDIRRRIEEGAPLSLAVEPHTRYFDGVARSLLAAGESGGKLDDMLKRLAQLTRQQIKIRASIIGAMAYPAVLIFISMNVLVTMLFFVLPRFQGLFETLGSALPPTTQMLVSLSDFLRGYWGAVVPGVIVLVFGIKMWLGTDGGKRWMHALLIRSPYVGVVARSFICARIARVLGVLLEARVPMLEALALTKQAAGNRAYQDLLTRAEELVTKGDNMSTALDASTLVNKAMVEAIRSGERSGQLPAVLMDVAEFMDEDNEIVLRSLSSVIEPIILIFLGVIIGFVAVSMFLPLFDLATVTQRS